MWEKFYEEKFTRFVGAPSQLQLQGSHKLQIWGVLWILLLLGLPGAPGKKWLS
jgi:hypothetical protein